VLLCIGYAPHGRLTSISRHNRARASTYAGRRRRPLPFHLHPRHWHARPFPCSAGRPGQEPTQPLDLPPQSCSRQHVRRQAQAPFAFSPPSPPLACPPLPLQCRATGTGTNRTGRPSIHCPRPPCARCCLFISLALAAAPTPTELTPATSVAVFLAHARH
jgi:hypothetical protein